MQCLSESSFSRLLSSSLHPGEESVAIQHLDACRSCQQRLEAMSGDGPWLHALRDAAKTDSAGRVRLEQLYALRVSKSESEASLDQVWHGTPLDALLDASQDPNCIGLFDGYGILGVLGRGGMGIVLEALDPQLERHVALKLLAPAVACDPQARSRFMAEARAIASVSHPNVVQIYQVAEFRQTPYLLMERVYGESLASLQQSQSDLHWNRALGIIAQVCAALAATHARGITHRDIKPANILIDSANGTVKLTDFGLAQSRGSERLTLAGAIVGTPHYMSPEQASGGTVDHRSDLFSLGVVLYQLIAGRLPFDGDQPLSVVHQIVSQDPPQIEADAAPLWVRQIVEDCLEKSPENRPPSAEVLLERLRATHMQGSIAANASQSANTHIPGNAKGKRTAGAVLILLVLVTALFAWMNRAGDAKRAQLATGPAVETRPGAVVVHTNDGGTRMASGLAEAVRDSRPGEHIEVREPGRYALDPSAITNRQLVIKATPHDGGAASEEFTLELLKPWRLVESSHVSLMGFHLQLSEVEEPGGDGAAGHSINAPEEANSKSIPLFELSNATLVLRDCAYQNEAPLISLTGASIVDLSDSSILVTGSSPVLRSSSANGAYVALTNCVLASQNVFDLQRISSVEATIQIRRCTVLADRMFCLQPGGPPFQRIGPIHIEAEGNAIQASFLHAIDTFSAGGIAMMERRARDIYENRIDWRGEGNLFAIGRGFLGVALPDGAIVQGRTIKRTLDFWREVNTLEGNHSRLIDGSILEAAVHPRYLGSRSYERSDFSLKATWQGQFGADL